MIETDQGAADAIQAALANSRTGSFDVERVRQLSEGLERLSKKGIAAVLLNLSLPDSQGIETFDKLFTSAPDVPILILGGHLNEELAKQAVARGAQDYLLPGHLNGYSLPRPVHNSIDRKVQPPPGRRPIRQFVRGGGLGRNWTAQRKVGSFGQANLARATGNHWRSRQVAGFGNPPSKQAVTCGFSASRTGSSDLPPGKISSNVVYNKMSFLGCSEKERRVLLKPSVHPFRALFFPPLKS